MMKNEKKNGKLGREKFMDEINNLKEEENKDDEGESILKSKLLANGFNYWGDFLYYTMLQLKDKNRRVRFIEVKSRLKKISNTTYDVYLETLRKNEFIMRTGYGEYLIKEKLMRFLQKYYFVINSMHEGTYSNDKLNQLINKTEHIEETEVSIEEKKDIESNEKVNNEIINASEIDGEQKDGI